MSANDELQAHTCEKVVEEYENIKQTVIKCGYGNCPFTDEFCASGDCPYDPDNSVNTDKTITVEKEVYEAVLRNSLRVNELEEENLQLKQKVTSRNKRLQKYKKLKGELATLASNRNILIKRLKEENQSNSVTSITPAEKPYKILSNVSGLPFEKYSKMVLPS